MQVTHAFASDLTQTARRCAELDAYSRANVLDGARFICRSGDACRASHSGAFYEAQAHHVGNHYDLSIDGRPVRIVVTGQEYGHPPARVSLSTRHQMIAAQFGLQRHFFRDGNYGSRNPHMRGTTSLLRLLLGKGLGSDFADEFVTISADRVHLFECFALVNFLLCSAVAGEQTDWVGGVTHSGARGRSNRTMQRNCAAHYRRAIEILEPTVIVAQGKGVRRWMDRVIDRSESVHPTLPIERVMVGAVKCHLLTFSHPAAPTRENWGMNERQPYLIGTVGLTVERFLADGQKV